MTGQLRRASVSVAAKIAEGASRCSRKDQVRFFEMVYGSLCEIVTMLRITLRRKMVEDDIYSASRQEIAKMFRMLSGLRRAALADV